MERSSKTLNEGTDRERDRIHQIIVDIAWIQEVVQGHNSLSKLDPRVEQTSGGINCKPFNSTNTMKLTARGTKQETQDRVDDLLILQLIPICLLRQGLKEVFVTDLPLEGSLVDSLPTTFNPAHDQKVLELGYLVYER